MKTLIIINDGTLKAYNALRVTNQLGRDYKDTELSTMAELSEWIANSEKVLTF